MWIFQSPRFFWPFVIARFADTDKWVHNTQSKMALITPKDAVSKKVLLNQYEPTENEFNTFVEAVNSLKLEIDGESRESFNEGRIRDFLKKAFYFSTNYIDKPDKGDIDLVILEDSKPKSDVKVIIEAKRVANKAEFPTADGEINVKALQETVLYYLRESISKKNKGLSRIVITNGIEWFIFSAEDFETLFVTENKSLRKHFEDYEGGRLSFSSDTNKFYSDIAKPAIEEVKDRLNYVWFDINKLTSKSSLITVFKILSPFYLLNKPCATDSNVLNDKFYKELLHIIGLYENDKDESGKKKAKKTIERLPEDKRESGSLLENAITRLSYKNPFNLFDRAIQLVIVWINRILFLKLLEAQLVKWHGGDKNYKFLTTNNLPEYYGLNDLFFGVLAKRPAERVSEFEKYKDIPYLNSSLFEQTEEMNISELNNNVEITVFKNTILKGEGNNKLNPLEYLLRFLDAYDFGAAESEEGLRKESKTLINASVLGLIFEKINGYKDGSFYTPGTITQYMCKETIRRAVVQKFNDTKGWNCKTLVDVHNHCHEYNVNIDEKNQIINSISICDPAVGSGHFLVSALNELISIKHQLHALRADDGTVLTGNLNVENDELYVTYSNGDEFAYNPKLDESQKIQETLFNEKRTIIENCLFGVDINPNSVNICRLRLWIELLKNAYYHADGTLETLPNIDINIKCGNSLVSRYEINVDISNVLKKKELNDYKEKVRTYKDTPNKEVKHDLEKLIEQLKEKFKESLKQNSGDFKKYKNAQKIIFDLTSPQLFEPTKKEKKEIEERIKNAKKEIADYEEKQKNSIYENALEWRLEFPETLDEEGNFVGFDVVIGNPPYIPSGDQNKNVILQKQRQYLTNCGRYRTLYEKWDLYIPFVELGLEKLCAPNACFSMIIPYPYTNQKYAKLSRKMLADDYKLYGLADFYGIKIFPDANVINCIPFVEKSATEGKTIIYKGGDDKKVHENFSVPHSHLVQNEETLIWNLTKEKRHTDRYSEMHCLRDYCYITKGMVLHSEDGEFTKEDLISETKDNIHCKQYIEGKDIEKWYLEKVRYLEYGTERCPKKVSRPTFEELYTSPKLLINALGEMKCYIDLNGEYYCEQQVRIALLWKELKNIDNRSIKDVVRKYSKMNRSDMECLSQSVELQYLLGILNSKYASHLLTNIRSGDHHIVPEHIRDIPIPSATSDQQQPIIDAVNKILEAKKQDSKANKEVIDECEREIDIRVYKLYGLTLDEAQVIDASVTVEDFDKY